MVIMKTVEKIYPYVFAAVIMLLLIVFKIDITGSNNTNSALEAIITVSSIIIGFIGAILPVIMSMKNDSKIVRYVFEKDKDKLFLKYIKQTIIMGIILIVISVALYFRDVYASTNYGRNVFYVISFFLAAFLLCTYRCLSNMLNLIFANDIEIHDDGTFYEKSEREKEFEKRLEKSNIN